ncbi:MAG: hypothetical protein ABGW69_00750 [Nanoarchaeota archaeon]
MIKTLMSYLIDKTSSLVENFNLFDEGYEFKVIDGNYYLKACHFITTYNDRVNLFLYSLKGNIEKEAEIIFKKVKRDKKLKEKIGIIYPYFAKISENFGFYQAISLSNNFKEPLKIDNSFLIPYYTPKLENEPIVSDSRINYINNIAKNAYFASIGLLIKEKIDKIKKKK